METFPFKNIGVDVGSYPTYEEWKQFLHHWNMNNGVSSYPTYEEWKHKLTF